MLNLNTHQLNVFLVAAETLNFTHAAQHLQMTQPSVSQHIQSLEEHFGLPLFIRSGRSIELTDAGLALIPLARELVYLSIHLEETMASLKGDIFGHLLVGCSTITGRYVLPNMLASLHKEYPQVRASCQIMTQERALQLLGEGKIHLALASNPPFAQDIEFRKIITEKIILIAHPDHPWSKRSQITIEELQNGEYILPEEGSETHSAIREALAQLNQSVYKLEPVVYLGSLEAVALSVKEGLGVGFVPDIIANRLVHEAVTIINVQGLDIRREVYVARNTSRPATAAQDAFWNLIINLENETIPQTTIRLAAEK